MTSPLATASRRRCESSAVRSAYAIAKRPMASANVSAPAEVAGDESRADRARVRTRQRASAQRGVVDETRGPHPEQIDTPLHVSQLPHVEVGGVGVRPAEKDVAHRLHRALTDDDALAAVLVLAAADVRLEHGLPRFLHLQEQRVERTPPFEQDDGATRARRCPRRRPSARRRGSGTGRRGGGGRRTTTRGTAGRTRRSALRTPSPSRSGR